MAGGRRQPVEIFINRIGLHEKAVEALQPGVLVRRKYAERPAILGQHLVFFEDDLVFAGDECPALARQRGAHRGVALDRGRLVIVIGEHGIGLKAYRQRRDLLARAAMQDLQPAAVARQFLLQFTHAEPDELDAPVVAPRQPAENFAIEHECAVDAPALLQRGVEGGMIETAQIAPEPHHGDIVGHLCVLGTPGGRRLGETARRNDCERTPARLQ